ncbi:MAG: hypothetical protein E7397_00690 [Ruminococcaceae bacterium]|nr:hypothetical protein [Oscillospiraceae bacterium]
MNMKKNEPYNQIRHFADLRDMLCTNAKEFAAEPAFQYESAGKRTEITYSKFWDDVCAFGAYLCSLGLEKAKVGLVGNNCYEWIVTYFATVISAEMIFPLDKELGDPELLTLIKAGQCNVLVYSKGKKNILPQAEELGVEHFLCMDEFEDILEAGKALIESGDKRFFECNASLDDVCAVIYTSGTTGNPKGVMLSQRNLMSDAIHSLENLSIPKGTVLLLPLNHTFGFMAGVLCQLWVGFPVYINDSLKTVLKSIQAAKPGHLSVVPLYIKSFYKNIWSNVEKQGKTKQLKALIKASNAMRKAGIDMRKTFFKPVLKAFGGNLEMLITGGAPIDDFYMKAFDDFGIKIINGYGITECSPIVSTNRACWIKSGSVGLPIPGMHARIDEPNENGEGEVCIKGDIVMKGYYENQEATDAVLIDGWFHTGDIGKIDEDGFLYITGRKKNMILTGNGKNVYPEELENLLEQVENVTEVVVYSEDDVITAEIYTEAGADAHEQIKKDVMELNKDIAGYKQIRKIKFRKEEFVKTSTKKIKRG